MKRWSAVLTLVLGLIFTQVTLSAQTEEESFSTAGKITQLNIQEKTLGLKREGGLELTFHVNDVTQILIGEEAKPLTDLAVGDSIEMEYVYNKDYEKFARTIRKSLTPPPSP